MIHKNTFKNNVTAILKHEGFVKKRASSMYLDGSDVIIVVNLQKSAWSDTHYINVGFWLKSFGEERYPLFNKCHLYFRVENLFPENKGLIDEACSLEESSLEVHTQFLQFFQQQLIPFFSECTNIASIKKYMRDNRFNHGIILPGIGDYLLEDGQ